MSSWFLIYKSKNPSVEAHRCSQAFEEWADASRCFMPWTTVSSPGMLPGGRLQVDPGHRIKRQGFQKTFYFRATLNKTVVLVVSGETISVTFYWGV